MHQTRHLNPIEVEKNLEALTFYEIVRDLSTMHRHMVQHRKVARRTELYWVIRDQIEPTYDVYVQLLQQRHHNGVASAYIEKKEEW